MENKFTFMKPKSWKAIDLSRFPEGSFAREINNMVAYIFATMVDDKPVNITLNNWGNSSVEIYDKLDNKYKNSSYESKESISIYKSIRDISFGDNQSNITEIKTIYFERKAIYDKNCYVTIKKVSEDSKIYYMMDILVKLDNIMLGFSTLFFNIDETDCYNSSIQQNPHIEQLINGVIQTIKEI